MIKLMGNKGGHLPVQLTGGGASGSGTNVKATFVKASGDQVRAMCNGFRNFSWSCPTIYIASVMLLPGT